MKKGLETRLFVNIGIIVTLIFLMIGCGGGGGKKNAADPGTPENQNPDRELSGIIVDSPIEGIHYRTSSNLEGNTDASGTFTYKLGDLITFSIANFTLPEIPAKNVITPFDLFSSHDKNDHRVINFLRLMQTLDDDGEIDSSIKLSPEHIQALTNTKLTVNDLSKTPVEFAALPSVNALVGNISHAQKLVTAQDALNHFYTSLANSSVIDLDADGTSNAEDNDDDNDGVEDRFDEFSWDATESADLDADGLGDNADTDDDNDQVLDEDDSIAQVIIDLDASIPAVTHHWFDPAQNRLYLTHKDALTLTVVDLTNNTILETLTFDSMPERMALSPDGSNLYVALLVQPHSSYWFDGDQSGNIGVIDTKKLKVTKTIPTDIDPYDLVVTSTGKLVVSSGSGQWTSIVAYEAMLGNELGRANIRQASHLSLHPTEKWVFAADTDVSPSDIEKFDISGTGISALGDSPYHGDHRMSGDVWASSDGKYVFTRGGDIFLASDMSYVRGLTDSNTSISDISFDENEQAAYVILSSNTIEVVNLQSLESIKYLDYPNNVIGAYGTGQYSVYVTETTGSISVIKEYNTCAGCGSNQAPQAQFSYTPTAGSTTDIYTFDASGSSDVEDGMELQFRWDLNNDGIWDTTFSSDNTIDHEFVLPGIQFVRLQVKDGGGLTTTVMQSFNVAQGIDNGIEVAAGTPYELPFLSSAVALDSSRSNLYVADKAAQRLYIVDLKTGVTEKYFEFKYQPDRLATSPDNSALYVALPTGQHNAYAFDESQNGLVAVIDLEKKAFVKMLGVNVDPYDLVVTRSDKLIISSGSGQWTNIFAYNAKTGTELGRASIRHRSNLSLHPSEQWVFAADTDVSPSDIEKFDITGEGITAIGDSPYHGDYRMNGNVWATPDGNHVITRGGDVFRAGDMTYVASMTSTGVSINSISFDEVKNRIAVIGSDSSIYLYDPSDWSQMGNSTTVAQTSHILAHNGEIYTISQQGLVNLLHKVNFP